MKMSKVLRYISQLVFWVSIVLFLCDVFKVKGGIGWTVLMTVLIVFASSFARKIKNNMLTFVAHLLVGVISGFFVAANVAATVTMFFGIGITLISLIASWADAEFMDKPHGFGEFLLLATYIAGAIMNNNKLWLYFIFFVMYTFIIFIEKNVSQNEEYIHGVSYTSVMDVKKMHQVANMVTLIISFIMLVLSVAFAMLGRISPIARLGSFIFSKIREWLGFLKKFNIDLGNMNEVDDKPSGTVDESLLFGDGSEVLQEESTADVSDVVIMAILITVTVLCLFFAIFWGLRRLYKYYLSTQKDGVDEEQFLLKRTKAAKKEDPRKSDASYSNRKAVRKIYKKRVKGKSRRREDFYNYTPTEQLNKSMAEGNDISQEIVEIYEKARYSKESITKEDVRTMKQ